MTPRRLGAVLVAAAVLSSLAEPVGAVVKPFSSRFTARSMPVGDATQYVRTGGTGAAVLLLHGFGDTGDMWQPLAEELAGDHRVIVPDLRGMGLSSHPEGGYEKAAQARDLVSILDRLSVDRFTLVTHDIGNMVGYALAAQYPDRVTRWVVMDAPLPGLGTWEKQLVNPLVWHFNFRGPDVERLVAGRERILLDRFYNELSANPKRIDEQTRQHYAALYARHGAIHSAFSGQFAAFTRDAEDNRDLFARIGKLKMPVLAIGGDHSYGAGMKTELEFVAEHVEGAVITDSGHWIMEEQPRQAVALILPFVRGQDDGLEKRLTADDVDRIRPEVAGAGTSGLAAVSTRVLFGNPAKPGLYTIELRVAPHTTIQPHSHRDMRTAVILDGVWQFGYGATNAPDLLKTLTRGAFYTEPAGQRHFARTGDEGATVVISGYGPTDTVYAR